MLKETKELLNEAIIECCSRNIADKNWLKNKAKRLQDKYGFPADVASDILSLREDLNKRNDFILFCILDTIDSEKLSDYFTPIEISGFKKEKYLEDKINFPLKYDMVEIAPDQWIGKISIEELMKLRDSQMIRYNENAQRSLKRIVRGDTEYYKIALNRKAVLGIQDLLLHNTFIPNTLTLNMPEDAIYTYSNGKLIIKEMTVFDILDGYHRYIAISNLWNLGQKIELSMELRIVQFTEERARQFIWQEDQKTKMKKIDSEAFNQVSEANKIVQRLNTGGSFAGKINQNNYIIHSGYLGKIIHLLWFTGQDKVDSSKTMEIRKEIQDYLDYIADNNPELLIKTWDFMFLTVIMVEIYNNCPQKDIIPETTKVLQKYNENIIPSRMNKSMINRLVTFCLQERRYN